MKKALLAILVVISIIVGFSVASAHKSKPIVPTEDYFSINATIEEISNEVNRQRTILGDKPLTVDTRLVESATKKAEELASGNVNPDNTHLNKQGVNGYSYIDKSIPECTKGLRSENLLTAHFSAGYYQDAKVMVDSWMNSKPHREAMLKSTVSIVGYAIRGRYVVQHMC